ncbi:DnaB-like helicase N-terminal domain-containing protein [Rhodococcus sp. NPDC019627]|uniref:DnaB-like helicase N-terminal domain-containing protein n=1 Tax=unclassified Rhodococcus (in: high G+C Gram-positive bacteria) TaxID=192944 RepID=UPI0033EBAA15
MTAALELVHDQATDTAPAESIEAPDLGIDAHTDVEVLCLCALLWAPIDAAHRAVDALHPADFQQPIHQELYTVIAGLVRAGAPHDPTMVAADLERTGKFAGHHGRQRSRHLASITTRGADHIALDHYTRAVISQAYRRSFRAAAQSLAQAAEQLPEDQLFEHMVALGRQQRAATQRLDHLRGADQ